MDTSGKLLWTIEIEEVVVRIVIEKNRAKDILNKRKIVEIANYLNLWYIYYAHKLKGKRNE